MFNPNANASPFNPLSPVIAIIAVVIFGTEVILELGAAGLVGGADAVGWRIELMRTLGFFDSVFEYSSQAQYFDLHSIARFFTYPFVHFAFTHAAFATVMLLALGKVVGDVFHTASVLAIFFISAAVGALAYGVVFNSQYPLVGAYPAIYGLLGAYTWMLWLTSKATFQSRLNAFRLVGFLVGLRLIFQFVVPFLSRTDAPQAVDWIADLAGFATGFLLSFVLAPDGRARVARWVNAIRQR